MLLLCFFAHLYTLTTILNCTQPCAPSLSTKSLPLQWNTSYLNLPSEHCRSEVYTRLETSCILSLGNGQSVISGNTLEVMHDLMQWKWPL